MTLVEIGIGLAIISIILMMGVPTFADWIHNLQIRNAAEGIQNGLQTARGEAVRRNANVEFVLTNPGATGGTGWTVRLLDGTVIQSKPDGEGSATAVVSVIPSGADTVTFNGFGRTPSSPPSNADGSAFITQLDVDSSVMSAATSRNMRVQISSGGQIRMCDPNVVDTADPRSC
jgi:type IV fimbrial biogenesis protein FimT